MFHKKYSVKERATLSKKESRKLREIFVGALREEHLDCLDSFWSKGDAVTRMIWEFSTGGSSAFYLVNDIPIVISVVSLPDDFHSILPKGASIITPTLFFLLFFWRYYKNEDVDIACLFGSKIFCRGATSQFILSGAHLMIPGILHATHPNDKTFRVNDLAFVFSLGTSFPYAVGLATEDLVNCKCRGRGLYIIHAYRDSLWDTYFTAFSAGCSHMCPVLPPAFRNNEVDENLAQKLSVATEVCEGEKEEDTKEKLEDNAVEAAGDESSFAEDALIKSTKEMFESEDALVDFALCEAVRVLSQSMLPMPLTEFSPLLLSNFPRIPGVEIHIDFKRTKYKKILAYLLSRSDLVIVSEEKKGSHFITGVNKSSDLLRQHRRIYSSFLELVHEPLKKEEAIQAEQQVLQGCGKNVFHYRIVSIETMYSPKGGNAMELKRLLCTGIFRDYLDENSLQTCHVQPSLLNFEDTGDNFLDMVYSRKHLCENLRKYIRIKGLLHIAEEANGAPSVQLCGALSSFATELVHSMKITAVEDRIIQSMFLPVHQIVMEITNIVNGSPTSMSVTRKFVKKGNLPKVMLSTERRQGNKIVTIVKGLDTYGFKLDILASQWKHQFSTSCCIHDPSKEMQRIKQGTKIALELHLGGDWLSKLKLFLTKDLGVPQHLITVVGKPSA